MRLAEIKADKALFWQKASTLFTSAYIAFPRGTLWQRDLHNVWRFKTKEAADAAPHSPVGDKISQFTDDYLVPVTTLNGLHLLLQIDGDAIDLINSPKFRVLAYGPTEKSVRAAGHEGLNKLMREQPTLNLSEGMIWCYKTYNSDASIFDLTEEDLE